MNNSGMKNLGIFLRCITVVIIFSGAGSSAYAAVAGKMQFVIGTVQLSSEAGKP